MNKLKGFIKNHQQQLVLTLGYLLVGSLAFGLGRVSINQHEAPEVKVEAVASVPDNYTPTVSGIQLEPAVSGKASTSPQPTSQVCAGPVKATASSMIYHLPGQSGYTKLKSQTCFDTEAAAIAAGYRKALK